ncbi:MAG: MlaD family protein [Prevotella sp.]|nr:MlaD family protein [Prevotella sp.]
MKITKEIKIALVAILGLVILFFGMNYLKGLHLFSSDTRYFLSFDDISGLSEAAPIYADGYKVGVVKNIDFDYEQKRDIMVEVGIDPNLRIPKGSSAEISSDLLGNLQVNLLLANNPRERLEEGATIPGSINAGSMGKLKDMIPTIEKMLPKLDSIMASLNTILADPAIAQTLHNAENITANLTTTSRELNTLMGNLNKNVPGMMAKANGVLDNTSQLTTNLNAKLTEIDVQKTMAQVDATMANLQQFTDKLNSNQGSLGLLMNDPTLYTNLNSTMLSADSLLVNFREHPKRYVHFSVFGKKDK